MAFPTPLGIEALQHSSCRTSLTGFLAAYLIKISLLVIKNSKLENYVLKMMVGIMKAMNWFVQTSHFSDLGDNFSLEGFGKKLYQNIIIDGVTIPEIIRRQQDGYGEEISSVITYEFTTPYKDITSIEFDDGNIYRIIGGKYAGEYSGFSVGE